MSRIERCTNPENNSFEILLKKRKGKDQEEIKQEVRNTGRKRKIKIGAKFDIYCTSRITQEGEEINRRDAFLSLSLFLLFFFILFSQSIRVETKRGRLFINEFQLYGCSPCTDSILFRAYCQIGQVVRLRITLPATLGRVHPLALVAARHLTLTLFKIN